MSVQNGYNLINRVFDISHSEVSIREKCGLLVYSPIAGGRLSGKYINEKNQKIVDIFYGLKDFQDMKLYEEKSNKKICSFIKKTQYFTKYSC